MAYDITIDKLGNVYVAGRSGDKAWIRKYDTNGNILWTKIYMPQNVSWCEVDGVDVDSLGNIYFCGRVGAGGPDDTIIGKIKPDGIILLNGQQPIMDHIMVMMVG